MANETELRKFELSDGSYIAVNTAHIIAFELVNEMRGECQLRMIDGSKYVVKGFPMFMNISYYFASESSRR